MQSSDVGGPADPPDPDDPERSDVGWGEAPEPPSSVGSDDWYRRERPPHHGD